MRKTTQIRNTPQQQRLLKLLRERGPRGVFVYEIQNSRPHGLGIAQYNTRISELRDMGHDIENVIKGHFVLKGSSTPPITKSPLKSDPERAAKPKRLIYYVNNGIRESTYV